MDFEDHKPIENVAIENDESQNPVYTNAKGEANLSVINSNQKLSFYHPDYYPLKKLVLHQGNKLPKVYLKRKEFELEELIISASKWSQKSSKIVSKTSSISQKEVALQNPQTTADLLGIKGNVFIQKSQQGGGSPIIRGFSANRLVYNVDGVRMNNAIFRSGNLQNVINLDPFSIERTEVLFGPGSVIYGSDAIGGVMSFRTLNPRLSGDYKKIFEGNAGVRYSSANKEKTGHLDFNFGKKKWALLTSVTYWDYDHLRQGKYGPDDYLKTTYVKRINNQDVIVPQSDPLLQIPTGYSQFNLMQKIKWVPKQDWDLTYALHYSTTSNFGRYDRHNRLINGQPRYATWDYGPQNWALNHLKIKHDRKNKWYTSATADLANQNFEESRINRNFGIPTQNITSENVKAYSANFDFLKEINTKLSLNYGVEGVINKVKSNGSILHIETNSTTKGIARYPNATWSAMGAYISSDYQWKKNITLQGGFRYNRFNLEADFINNNIFFDFPFRKTELKNETITGSIGSIFRFQNQWLLKTNFGTAFRAPNVDDLGKVFDSEPGALTVPNPNLKPEYAYNFDVGIAKIFKNRLQMELTSYFTHLDEALVRRNFSFNGATEILFEGELSRVQAIQNAATSVVYGLQTSLEYKFSKSWTLQSSFNYQKGIEETSDGFTSPSRHATPWFGLTRLSYQLKNLTLEINSNYQGEQSFEKLAFSERTKSEIYAKDENGNNFSPSWYTINFKSFYKINSFLNAGAGIENITNQRYRAYSSGLSGAGTNVILSIGANW